MAYNFGNKCAKNLCKRIVLLQLIIENVVTCFFWNTVYIQECSRVMCYVWLKILQHTCIQTWLVCKQLEKCYTLATEIFEKSFVDNVLLRFPRIVPVRQQRVTRLHNWIHTLHTSLQLYLLSPSYNRMTTMIRWTTVTITVTTFQTMWNPLTFPWWFAALGMLLISCPY